MLIVILLNLYHQHGKQVQGDQVTLNYKSHTNSLCVHMAVTGP